MEVQRNVAAPLPGFPLGANSRGWKGGGGLGLGRGQHWGGVTAQGGSMLERMKGPTGEEARWAKDLEHPHRKKLLPFP
jgi:hypothetical protein